MSKISFKSLLAKVPQSLEPFGYKTAQMGGIEEADGQQMERDFAQMAFMFVNDRAPGLVKYILGFEVVEREDDGSRAVGIFGCKISKDYYYIPAFFINNQIKGVDLLFQKRTNMFLPLQEDWINSIVNKYTIDLGEGVSQQDIAGDFESPNFDFLTHPPMGPQDVKQAETEEEPWSLKEAWDQMRGQIETMLEKDAEFQKSVAGFISSMGKHRSPIEKSAEDSALLNWMSDHGGPKAVSAFLTTLTSNIKYANAALTFYPSVESMYVHEFATLPVKEAAVRLVEKPESGMSSLDRSRLVRDGFSILDKRAEDDKTGTYSIDYSQRFQNPSGPGMYKVLLSGGGTADAWVFTSRDRHSHRNNNTIYFPDNDSIACTSTSNILVRDDKVKEPSAFYDKGISLADATVKSCYLLVNDKGESVGPYLIDSVSKLGDEISISVSYQYPQTIGTRRATSISRWADAPVPEIEYTDSTNVNTIALATHKGRLQYINNTMIVPANWKAVEVIKWEKIPWDDRKDKTYNPPDIGSHTDIDIALFKHAFHKFVVASDDGGSEYYFRMDDDFATRAMGYKKAFVTLVGEYGLSVDDTEDLLKEAAEDFKARRLIKLAQGVGVAMPAPQDPAASVDPYTGMPMYDMVDEQSVQGQMTGLPPMPDGNTPGIDVGGEAQVDPEAQDLAQQAAELGQKTVFDHSTIGGLSRLYDTSAVIDSYIPEMLQSLDRIGRILFLYYWKNADFAERYGSQDIADMEDLIRSVFKSFGTLVLRLRQKAIETDDARQVEI